jgi:hypothetical protein
VTWASRFRAGDLVEVRSREEILATLDEHGCVDGMPFMPEMLQFCGRQLRVGAVAHKACETARQTWTNRRVRAAVHLVGIRCDGSAHGGCQADCNIFWKDVWLRPALNRGGGALPSARAGAASERRGCTESQLIRNTRVIEGAEEPEPRYSCQATKLYGATEPLAWWDVRQYVLDVVTRNHSSGHVVGVLWLASLRWLLPRVPVGWNLFKRLHDWMHVALTGRAAPHVPDAPGRSGVTPVGHLNLRSGERVRVKPQALIEETLDASGRNRGLVFDRREMAPYCGGIFTVRNSLTKILDEATGKMLLMKQPCITLEGVVCKSEYSSCRLNCPREIPPYWRELWLERVNSTAPDESCLDGKKRTAEVRDVAVETASRR